MTATSTNSNVNMEAGLETCIRHPSDLSRQARREMFALMANHYDNMDLARFERDLDEKEWVIMTSTARMGVVGFTTLMRLTTELDGQRLSALFSGDTVLDPDLWGQSRWIKVWGRHVAQVISDWNEEPVYWLLLTATHRTYHSLPLFLNEFYPRRDVETPPIVARRMEALARLKFHEQYDPARGVVRLANPVPVRADRVALASEGLLDEDARFFAARNPGFLNGDYLVCIGEVSIRNRTRLGHRLARHKRNSVSDLCPTLERRAGD